MANTYELIIEPRLEEIEEWARTSTIKEIAAALGVSYSGFRNYIKKYPELSGAIAKGKTTPDYEALGCFRRRVTGYEYEEVTKELVGGKMITTKKVKKQMPPDVDAGKFWLKNRMPEDFKDKVENSVDIDVRKLEDLI